MFGRCGVRRINILNNSLLITYFSFALGIPGRLGLTLIGWRFYSYAFSWGLWRVCRKNFDGMDAIHVHGVRPVGIAILECSFWDHLPVVCTLHGIDSSLLAAYSRL